MLINCSPSPSWLMQCFNWWCHNELTSRWCMLSLFLAWRRHWSSPQIVQCWGTKSPSGEMMRGEMSSYPESCLVPLLGGRSQSVISPPLHLYIADLRQLGISHPPWIEMRISLWSLVMQQDRRNSTAMCKRYDGHVTSESCYYSIQIDTCELCEVPNGC